MFMYVINIRRYIKYFIVFFILLVVIASIFMLKPDTINVWSENREIPIYSVQCEDKKASITFDCAWGDSDIPQILEILKNEDVKATFFIVGQWAEKFPDKVKLIAQEGHDIASHSYSHLRMGALTEEKIRSEIIECGKTLAELSGKKIDLFRAPYGDYNNDVVNIARELGYYTIQWDVDSLDWKPDISREYIIERVISRTKPGSIILFHNDTTHTANVLPTIISSLKKSGYKLVPVSELIMRDNYTINFEGRQVKDE